MTTLYVEYCSNIYLGCSEGSRKEVILCLRDAALILATECEDADNHSYVGAFAVAEVCQWYRQGDCGGRVYYTFSYDESILADITVPLQSADITGVFCKGCLTDYYDYKIGSEVYVKLDSEGNQVLVTQHGCEYILNGGGGDMVLTPVINIDAITVDFGDVASTYTAIGFLDVEGKAKQITINNRTNEDVQLSYDGIADGPKIDAGAFKVLSFGANTGILETTDVYMKYISDAPTVGGVDFDGFY